MLGGNYFAQSYFGQSYPALPVGVPEWVSPSNHATNQSTTEPLVFLIPAAQSNLHFELQVDDASDFVGATSYKSWTDQAGWEYYDGAAWQPVPLAGVDPTYAGQQGRYTGVFPPATYYRRIRARIKA
jgi:hypothetical protein